MISSSNRSANIVLRQLRAASKSSNLQADPNATAVSRQISQTPPVSTVDPRRCAAARRTFGYRQSRSRDGDDLRAANLDTLDAKARRQQRMVVTTWAHGRLSYMQSLPIASSPQHVAACTEIE